MSGACVTATGALARDVLASADCLIESRIADGYNALLAPGGALTTALTVVLTIYVAIVGYRLILGRAGLTVGELVPHFIKIGLILALVTQWPTYQALVFDVLFRGPEQLAGVIVRQAGASGSGDVLSALQTVFDRLTDQASDLWAQVTPAAAPAAPVAPVAPGSATIAAAKPLQFAAPQFAAAGLWFSALLMMASTVGVLLVVRIILALLLVLGPLFIACALFSASRGLFEGWLRTTVKFAVVPLFTLPFAAGMIAVMMPFVLQLGDAPLVGFRDSPVPAILLVTLIFAAVLFQVVRIAGSIASGIRLPRATPVPVVPVPLRSDQYSRTTVVPMTASRTESIIEAVGATSTIQSGRSASPGMIATTRIIGGPATAAPLPDTGNRIGQSYRRLTLATRPVATGAR